MSAFGSLYPAIDIDVSPAVSEVDALARVRFELGDASIGASSTELVVLPLPGSFALAWRLTVSGADVHEDVFVDAHSGAILKSLSNRHDAAAVGHGTGVLGDDKKVSDDGVSSGFLARDLLRPPEIVTFDMRQERAFRRAGGHDSGRARSLWRGERRRARGDAGLERRGSAVT